MSRKIEGRQVTEDDARRCLAAVDSSGLTLHAWCRANHMVPTDLYGWRKRLAASPAGMPGFVEVTMGPTMGPSGSAGAVANGSALAPTSSRAPVGARYEVVVGDIRVVVGDDFQDNTLARLLHVARTC